MVCFARRKKTGVENILKKLYCARNSICKVGRRTTIILLLIIFSFAGTGGIFNPSPVHSVEDRGAEEEVVDVDLDFMEEYWQQIEGDVEEYFPSLHWRDIYNRFLDEDEEGGFPHPREFLTGLSRMFMGELLLNFRFMGKLLVLAVAAAFLRNLQTSFESQGVAWVTQSVVLLAMVALILPGFIALVNMARDTVEGMVDFMLGLVPVLLMLLSSLGSLSAATMFHPALVFSVHFFSTIINNVVFPLVFFSAALYLVNHFSPHLRLEKLADFFKDLCVWGLGLLLTIFGGVITLQGMAGTVTDAVTLRTAKYLTGTFVPVVGKMLADSVETVAGASLLIKNGAGLAALIILIITIAFPLVKLFALVIIYKAAAALVQIVGETSLGECLNTMGNCLTLVMASLAVVSVMFFLSIMIIVGSGNALLMLR